jgi:hypothetical protein
VSDWWCASLPEFGVVAALTEDVTFANVGGEQVGRYSPEQQKRTHAWLEAGNLRQHER